MRHLYRWLYGTALWLVVVFLGTSSLSVAQTKGSHKINLPLVYGPVMPLARLVSPESGSTVLSIAPELKWMSGNDPDVTAIVSAIAYDPAMAEVTAASYQGLNNGLTERERVFVGGSNLEADRTFYWQIELQYKDAPSYFSPVWSFTTSSGGTIPPAVTLVEPMDGSTITETPILLRWNAVDGAIAYRICFQPLDLNTNLCLNSTDTDVFITPYSGNRTYEWWVRARTSYAWSPDSEIRRFNLQE